MDGKLFESVIHKVSNMKANIYKKNKDTIYGFVKQAAEEKNLKYKTQQIKKQKIKTELFSDDVYIGGYTNMKPSTTHRVAFNLCKDKFKLERFLSLMVIPTFDSKIFYENEMGQAQEYIESNLDTQFVLKPLSLSGGRGIEFNVNNHNFDQYWNKSMEIQKENNVKPLACIVQPFIKGFDIRVTIIEGTFSAALLRLPAHVIGDGKQSISQLIEAKNLIRGESEYFNNKLIKINDTLISNLKDQNLALEDVVSENKVVQLSHIGNIVAGADSIDITDTISEELINLATNATAAVPGLYTSGVDILTPDYTKEKGYIIEVNTNANNRMHELPLKGKKRSPYRHYVETLIVQHKISNDYPLTEDEELLNNKIQKFLKLKTEYATSYFEITEF